MELRVEIQPGMHDPVTWAMQVECNSACSFVQSKAPGLIRLWIICDVRWCLRARTMSSMGTLPWRWNTVAASSMYWCAGGSPRTSSSHCSDFTLVAQATSCK